MCRDSTSGELRLRLRRRGGDRLRLALRALRAGEASSRFARGDRLREGDRLKERRRGESKSRMSAS
jgi:hypothetical protein